MHVSRPALNQFAPVLPLTGSLLVHSCGGVEYDSAGAADVCGELGADCGAKPCIDWEGCSMQLEMLGAMMPDAVNQPVETQQQWACDMDVAAHWPLAPPGTTFKNFCPVLCNVCEGVSQEDADAMRAKCQNANAVYEITSSGFLPLAEDGTPQPSTYKGCWADNEGSQITGPRGERRPMDFQSEINQAWPSIDDMTLGKFDIDHTYGDGGNDEGDYWIPVDINTDQPQHTFIGTVTNGDNDWNGGSWEVISSDKAACDAATAVDDDPATADVDESLTVGDACRAAGVCQLFAVDTESCTPTGHVPDACGQSGRSRAVKRRIASGDLPLGNFPESILSDDCCTGPGLNGGRGVGGRPEMMHAGVTNEGEHANSAAGAALAAEATWGASCADGTLLFQDEANPCWSCSDCSLNNDALAFYRTYCAAPDTDPSPTAFPDCSFTPGDPGSCGAGCTYQAPTFRCGPKLFAGKEVKNEGDMQTLFEIPAVSSTMVGRRRAQEEGECHDIIKGAIDACAADCAACHIDTVRPRAPRPSRRRRDQTCF